MALVHGGDIYGYREDKGAWPLDFSANVNPFGVPLAVQEAVKAAVTEADVYPDPLCRELVKALTVHERVAEEQVICGNGAADLIWRLVRALKPRKALLAVPTFAEYGLALQAEDCVIETYLMREDCGFQLDEGLLEALQPGIELLVLCNPNNPTGLCIEPPLLRRIVSRCAKLGAYLLLDECFIDFLDEPDVHSLNPLLGAYPKLVIVKAFTKLYGMAGLRLGYLLSADNDLLVRMREAGQPWAVSSLAQAAGLAALHDTAYLEESLPLIRQEREFLSTALQALGFRVYPSQTNYLFFYSEQQTLAQDLYERGILIRDCSNYQGLGPGYYRIAVRRHADHIKLLEALHASINDVKGEDGKT